MPLLCCMLVCMIFRRPKERFAGQFMLRSKIDATKVYEYRMST